MKKYFYIEDHAALLFKANGTGLTASVLAVAKVVPSQSFDFSIFPSCVYFLGLIAAFFVHAIISTKNADTNRRERRDYAVDSLMEIQKIPNLPNEQKEHAEEQWNSIKAQNNTLATVSVMTVLNTAHTISYLISLVSFFVATCAVLYILA